MGLLGTVNKEYVSSINFLDQREILEQVLDMTSEDRTILDILELTGRMVQTDMPTYSHFANDYIFVAGHISAVSATAAEQGGVIGGENQDLVITLAADEQMPVEGEEALFANKRQGRVDSINKTTRVITIKPFSLLQAADTISPVGNTVAAGQKVTFFSGSYGEGSGAPEGKRPRLVRSENQIQIFKTYGEITDLQKVATVEVKFDGRPHILYKVQHDTLLEHRMKIAFGLLVGTKAKFKDKDGNDVYKTQGLRKNILYGDGSVLTTGGVDVPLSTTIAMGNFKTMSRTFDKRGAGPEYWLWCGGDIDADIDDMILALGPLANGGLTYNSWGIGSDAQRAVDLGVTSFKKYNRVWHKKKLLAYDHEGVFAPHADFNYASEAYAIPGGKMKQAQGGGMIDAIRTRYMANDGTDFGKWNEVLTGRLAPRPTSDKAVLGVSYETILGLEIAGHRQFGIFSK
jgi:hypothetical protein